MSNQKTPVVFGTNGTAQVSFEGAGNDLVALFVKLCRGFDVNLVKQDVNNIVAKNANNLEVLVDLFVLTFQTRDCRGGKGERDLFRALLLGLYNHFPREVIASLPLITEYGYFKDFEALFEQLGSVDTPAAGELRTALVTVYSKYLKEDDDKLKKALEEAAQPEGVSLAAKYAPRLNKKSRKSAAQRLRFGRAIRDAIFGDDPKSSELYRKMLSRLNEQILTTERLMSANRWDEIEVKRIPAGCLKRQMKAFLYEDKKGQIRDPSNQPRIDLRTRLTAPSAVKKIKGGQLFANELVRSAMRCSSTAEGGVLDAQWQDLVRTVQKQCEAFTQQLTAKAEAAAEAEAANDGGASKAATPAKPSFDLGNVVPLVDVSGSMSGTPMEVAVAMGLIVSELTSPAFRGRVLTFDSVPRWHKIVGSNIVERVRNLMKAPWGTSTNFQKAMQRIINVLEKLAVKTGKLAPIPELIVFSDMQFDQAGRGPWDTAYRTICQDFEDLGKRLTKAGVAIGEGPLKPPVITFWNINSRTTGLVTDANAKGVRLLSGFSQSLLKLLLSGALPTAPEADEEKEAPQVDPTETLRAALDDTRYDAVRLFLNGMSGTFADYHFQPAPTPEEEESHEKDPGLPATGGGTA